MPLVSPRNGLHQVVLGLAQIEPVDSLGESQVGVDTGNDDACIYRQQLDPYKGDPDVDVDHQAFVQDGVDDIRQAAGRRAIKISVARSTLCQVMKVELSL
jgi:hypothetical protein